MVVEIVAVICAGGLLLYLLWRLARGPSAHLHLPQGSKLPPVQGGIPWVGCALEFGKEPLWYIGKSHNKHGDIFTINVTGKWMTFVLDPKCYQHFFTSECVDFKAAIFPVVNKVAGITGADFFKCHMACHESLKGCFTSKAAPLCPVMCTEFHLSLSSYGESGEKEMYDFVQEAMFESVTRELFGRDNVPKDKAGMLHLMELFRKYDADFEYGADLPEILLSKWRKSKYQLLDMFRMAICGRPESEKNKKEQGLLTGVFTPLLEQKHVPHYLMIMFWAAHGNATPVVYWTISHILSEPELYKAALKDVEQITLFKDGELAPIEEKDLKKCSFTKRCVMESARMHAPGVVVRKVVKTHTLKDYIIPAGHMMLLSPYWSHRNPEYFPEPNVFKPDRWLKCDLDHHQFLKGFIPFGGGRYQCSGKVFAIMEMHLFVVVVLKMFDLELKDPLSPETPLHMLGATHPANGCRVKFTRKPRA